MNELSVLRGRSFQWIHRLASRLLTSAVLCAAALADGTTARTVLAADVSIRMDGETADFGNISLQDAHKLTIQHGATDSATSISRSDLNVGWDGVGTLTMSDGGKLVAVGSKDGDRGPCDGAVITAVGSFLDIGALNFEGAARETRSAAGTLQAASVGFGRGTGSICAYCGVKTLSAYDAGFIGATHIEGGTLSLPGTLGGTVVIASQNGAATTLAIGAAERSAAAFAGMLSAASICFEEADGTVPAATCSAQRVGEGIARVVGI